MTSLRSSDVLPQQRIFVREMRARRESAGLSRNKLAAALGCTPQWLDKVERYERRPSEGLADDLDTFYKTGGTFHRIWEDLSEALRRGLLSNGFASLIDAEKVTTRISYFEPLLIPGLFQTEEYMRVVFSTGLLRDKIEELVAIRTERQVIFDKADPPWFFLLIREAVIRDLPSQVRVGQCGRLLELMQRPKVTVQVIPANALVFVSAAFQLLGFGKAEDVVYEDGAGMGICQMVTEADAVRRYAVLFDLIRADALSAEESENLIRTIMESV